MAESVTFTTLGELIKGKRLALGMSLSDLGRLTGISKGVISKIECCDTKRPELRTLKPIADVLKITYEEIIDLHFDVQLRDDVLEEFLAEAIEIANTSLLLKVAKKFLENPKKDTYTLLEELYNLTATLKNHELRVSLYNTIIKYARTYGISLYIAKGLYQKYMIKREDLKHLEESFKVGEESLHYVDFLSQEEKFTLYYRMALHAHNIKKYSDCIKIAQIGFEEDTTMSGLRERVALAVCNSFMNLGDYATLEDHLILFEKTGYKFIIERKKFFLAIVLSRTGKVFEAIPLLRQCLDEATKSNLLHRINELLEALFRINDLDSIGKIIESEEKKLTFQEITPYQASELGQYFKLKGNYLIKRGLFDEGMEAFLQSINYYGKINAFEDIAKCTDGIFLPPLLI
ncbi:helix-turn-helix transcriptional regulator [Brevibacillus laterosporus]|uniref:helix-turn-helix domain-containing protein n=1 Tax=Brevibacillus laterosporus TaxID=1465 RepID=UPI002E20953C|nr:helix-turn-helix transcriptional regulator [Brevibacillus laterosporus]